MLKYRRNYIIIPMIAIGWWKNFPGDHKSQLLDCLTIAIRHAYSSNTDSKILLIYLLACSGIFKVLQAHFLVFYSGGPQGAFMSFLIYFYIQFK